MTGRDQLLDLLHHMEWADALAWKTVRGTSGANQDQRLIGLLFHLHQVQSIYWFIWQGEAPQITDVTTYADAAAVANWARPYYAKAFSFVETLDESALVGSATFPWADQIAARFGAVGPVTLGEAILQVVMHSTYHRAQVATRVRELGGEPALTDYVGWVWMKRPDPEWD